MFAKKQRGSELILSLLIIFAEKAGHGRVACTAKVFMSARGVDLFFKRF
jgi:hypothetical protein